MELKLCSSHAALAALTGLNRTFYGIETYNIDGATHEQLVLIVPFMELKQISL